MLPVSKSVRRWIELESRTQMWVLKLAEKMNLAGVVRVQSSLGRKLSEGGVKRVKAEGTYDDGAQS